MSTPPFPGFGGEARPFPGLNSPAFPGLSSPGAASSSDPLGGASFSAPSRQSSQAEKPPVGLLVAAVALPLLTVPLLLLDAWYWHVAGWAVASFSTAGLLIAFTLIDTGRRASAWYLGHDGTVRGLRRAAILLALLAAAAHSYLFADWFSRLGVFA
ncbi:hypothetical protein ACI784_11115 [Geodermatophilus sp. SYSU D01186]